MLLSQTLKKFALFWGFFFFLLRRTPIYWEHTWMAWRRKTRRVKARRLKLHSDLKKNIKERERGAVYSERPPSVTSSTHLCPDLNNLSFTLLLCGTLQPPEEWRSFSLPEYYLDIFLVRNGSVGRDFATIIGYNLVVPYIYFFSCQFLNAS